MHNPPIGQLEIYHFFGYNPENQYWLRTKVTTFEQLFIVSLKLPEPILYDDGHTIIRAIQIHKSLAGSVYDILNKLRVLPGVWNQLRFSGSYVYRTKRGNSGMSMHSLGAAIDFNAAQFPMQEEHNSRDPLNKVDYPQWFQTVIYIFESHGWKWGGDFGDPMHFQYGSGY